MSAETTTSVRDVIIVGSGPAGYAAAVYAARANLNPVLIRRECLLLLIILSVAPAHVPARRAASVGNRT